MQTYQDKITQVCQEIRNIKLNKFIAVRNPTAWADGTTHKVVLDKKTNNKIIPGIHNQDSSQPPEDTDGAYGRGCLLSKNNSTANQTSTRNNPGHHNVSHHAPSSPPDETPQLSPLAPLSLS